MLYAILCYNDEAAASCLAKEDGDALIAKRRAVGRSLEAAGQLAAMVGLMPATSATTVRWHPEETVLDGPFAETHEQLGALYIVDCPSLAAVIQLATVLGGGEPGALEIRPLRSLVQARGAP